MNVTTVWVRRDLKPLARVIEAEYHNAKLDGEVTYMQKLDAAWRTLRTMPVDETDDRITGIVNNQLSSMDKGIDFFRNAVSEQRGRAT